MSLAFFDGLWYNSHREELQAILHGLAPSPCQGTRLWY